MYMSQRKQRFKHSMLGTLEIQKREKQETLLLNIQDLAFESLRLGFLQDLASIIKEKYIEMKEQ